MYKILFFILSLLGVFSVSAQQTTDTFHCYFDLNIATISKNTARKIDLLIYNDRIINGSSVMVIGYADYLGSEGYNKGLSMRRAQSIKEYLVKFGIESNNIVVCLGKGQVHRPEMTDKDGYPDDRRVDIVVNNGVKIQPVPSKTPKQPYLAGYHKPKKDSIAAYSKNNLHDINELTSLKEGQTIRLKNVYFPSGSHIIKPESYKTLEMLFQTLKDNPNLKISIEGHVCCIQNDVPDALDNETNEPVLSINRAKAIYMYLVDKGIEDNRLKYTGFGKRFPIVEFEQSEEDAEKNRRVEIRIISNK